MAETAMAVWLPATLVDVGEHQNALESALPDIGDERRAFLATSVPWVMQGNFINYEGDYPVSVLLRPSNLHGRSAVFDPTSVSPNGPATLPNDSCKTVVRDEFGNPYGSYSYKGSFADDIQVFTGASDPNGLRFNGLQTSYSIGRCLKASELLRAAGVDTEWIAGVFLPKEMPYKGKFLPTENVMAALLVESISNPEPVRRRRTQPDTPPDPPLHDSLLKFSKEAEFIVTLRAMQVSERLGDLMTEESSAALHHMLKKAMMVQRLAHVAVDVETPDRFKNEESYLADHIGRMLGTNVRKMHDLGLAHTMLHMGNILTTGGIMDLDSVTGPAIDLDEIDKSVPYEKYEEDITTYLLSTSDLGNVNSLFEHLATRQVIEDGAKAAASFKRSLFEGYMESPGEPVVPRGTLLKWLTASEFPEFRGGNKRGNGAFDATVAAACIDAFTGLEKTTPPESLTLTNDVFKHAVVSRLTETLLFTPDGALRAFGEQFSQLVSVDELEQAMQSVVEERAKTKEHHNQKDSAFFERLHDAIVQTIKEDTAAGKYAPYKHSSDSMKTVELPGGNVEMAEHATLHDALQHIKDQSGVAFGKIYIRDAQNRPAFRIVDDAFVVEDVAPLPVFSELSQITSWKELKPKDGCKLYSNIDVDTLAVQVKKIRYDDIIERSHTAMNEGKVVIVCLTEGADSFALNAGEFVAYLGKDYNGNDVLTIEANDLVDEAETLAKALWGDIPRETVNARKPLIGNAVLIEES